MQISQGMETEELTPFPAALYKHFGDVQLKKFFCNKNKNFFCNIKRKLVLSDRGRGVLKYLVGQTMAGWKVERTL